MASLRYLSEHDVQTLLSVMGDVFPGTPAFTLQGSAGEGRLSSALAQPQWPHHRTLQQKAAVLHYHLNRDHPFIDGNKRFAVAAMEMFVLRNDAMIFATDDELVDFSLRVASGEMSREDCALYLRRRTLRLTWTDEQTDRWFDLMPAADAQAVVKAGEWLAERDEALPDRILKALLAAA